MGNANVGGKIFKAKRATCHSCMDGGPNKQGPNLWGIMARAAGESKGFGFTDAFKKAKFEWTSQTMFDYLANPKKYVKGTNMAFPGFKKEADRANMVAYLN